MRAKARGGIFVISGPSGSGKTTLAKGILALPVFRRKLVRSVSLTTRPRRTGEVNSRDYFFVSRDEFSRLKRNKKILEWTRYLGYDYGTPKALIDRGLSKKKFIVLCLDIRGARRVRFCYPDDTTTIFIMPPSFQRYIIHNDLPFMVFIIMSLSKCFALVKSLFTRQ